MAEIDIQELLWEPEINEAHIWERHQEIRRLENAEGLMKESKYLKYPTQAHGAIRAFNSYEEEAAWWDETDTGTPEIEAEMIPVTIRSTKFPERMESLYNLQS